MSNLRAAARKLSVDLAIKIDIQTRGSFMTITEAQLRTLRLLHKKAARRVYRTDRAGDYSWVHEEAHTALTSTLHRLFNSGYATVSADNRDMAVITSKGRAVIAARGSC